MQIGTIIMLGFIIVLAIAACVLVSESVKLAGKKDKEKEECDE